MTQLEQYKQWLNESESALVNSYKSYGLKASGRWEKELENKIEYSQDKIKLFILGAAYTGAMNTGRKPSEKGSKPGSLFAIIEQWIKDKGITAKDEISDKSLAYLITRKIHKEGVKVPNQHNAGNFIENAIDEQRIQSLISIVRTGMLEDLKSDVMKAFKNGNN